MTTKKSAAPVKGKAAPVKKAAAPVKGKAAPVKGKAADKGLTLVLTADKRIALAYVRAIEKAEGIATSAERDFVRGFCTNHQGQESKVAKAGMKSLRESGAFGTLSNQSVDNLSSMAQYVFALPKDKQAALFDAPNFRVAYKTSRGWDQKVPSNVPPAPSSASKTPGNTSPSLDCEIAPKAQETPRTEPESFDEAVNRVIADLNDVVQSISEVLNQYPNHVGGAAVEMLARDIGTAIDKAAKARLQLLNKLAA